MSVIDMTVFERMNARIKALEENAGFHDEHFDPIEASALTDWMCEMEDRLDQIDEDNEERWGDVWDLQIKEKRDDAVDWRVSAVAIAAMVCMTAFWVAAVLS